MGHILPLLRTKAGGAGGRSPMAEGSGVSPDSFFPPSRPAAWCSLFKNGTKRGIAQQGVPGDAVPWPGVRGCPPTLSSPFSARRRRDEGVPDEKVKDHQAAFRTKIGRPLDYKGIYIVRKHSPTITHPSSSIVSQQRQSI